MKSFHGLLFALGSGLAICGWAETGSPARGRYQATVRDAAGNPADGATVECYAFPGDGFCSGAKMELAGRASAIGGRFQLTLPLQGSIVIVRKEGLAPTWRTFFFSPMSDFEEELTLGRPSTLSGAVVDEAGRPVAQAEVFVAIASLQADAEQGSRGMAYLVGQRARELFSARTSVDGRFVIRGFPAGASAELLVQAEGKAVRRAARRPPNENRLPWRAGEGSIRLVIEPAGAVEGRITADNTDRLPPTAALRLLTEGGGSFGVGQSETVESRADGRFRIPDVPAGRYELRTYFRPEVAPGWVATPVAVSVEPGETNSEVLVRAMRGGVLEVTLLDRNDRRPLPQTHVVAFLQQSPASRRSGDLGVASWFTAKMGYLSTAATPGMSGADGKAFFRLPPGDYELGGVGGGAGAEILPVTVEAGKTSRVEMVLGPPAQIDGIVRGPDGRPAPGVELWIMANPSVPVTARNTDRDGRFILPFNPQEAGPPGVPACILARDPQGNLAVAQEIDEDAGNVEMTLGAGVTLAGRVASEGNPVTNATVTVLWPTRNLIFQLRGVSVSGSQPGQFEIRALLPGRRYTVRVSAPGFGLQSSGTIQPELEPGRVELDPFNLKPANLKVAGRVLDLEGKPVAGASVRLIGEGQPQLDAIVSGGEGWFVFGQVCAGSVRLLAHLTNLVADVSVQAGATNVVLQLGSFGATFGTISQRAPLKGKPLPDLAGLGIGREAQPAGKLLLLCLLDVEQRLSRRTARLLSEQHEALARKGITVLAVQTVSVPAEALQAVTNASPLAFPLACIKEKSTATKWATGVEALPWLILCDRNGKVADEGFAVEELPGKLSLLEQ